MDAREIIAYIATAPKKTPVKAYVREAPGALVNYPQGSHVFGDNTSKVVFGDWGELGPVLEEARADGRIVDVMLENDRRNSGVPLLDLKGINARIEPGALIREKVEIGDGAVIMMGAVINIGARIGAGTMIDMGAVLGGLLSHRRGYRARRRRGAGERHARHRGGQRHDGGQRRCHRRRPCGRGRRRGGWCRRRGERPRSCRGCWLSGSRHQDEGREDRGQGRLRGRPASAVGRPALPCHPPSL